MNGDEILRVLQAFEQSGLAHVRVATPLALYRLKKGTVRAKDRDDALALRLRFGLQDEP